MRDLHKNLLRAACLVGLTLASPASADEADDHFAKGRAAFSASKFEDALREFQSAWAVRKTHDLAASMAQAEMQLGRHVAAAEHLTYALRHFPVSGKEDVRKKMEVALAETKSRIGSLKIEVSVDGAELLVDGKSVGRAPLEQEVFVEPGAHKIEARLAGHMTDTKDVTAAKGGSVTAAMVLKPEPAPLPTVTATASATVPPPQRNFVPAYIGFGVGAAGLVLGAVAGGVALGKLDEIKKVCGETLKCPETVRGQGDEAGAFATASTTGFVLAAVGAAVGLTFVLLPPTKKPTPSARVTVGPAFVGVKGAF